VNHEEHEKQGQRLATIMHALGEAYLAGDATRQRVIQAHIQRCLEPLCREQLEYEAYLRDLGTRACGHGDRNRARAIQLEISLYPFNIWDPRRRE
jgi:hypothetical protein